MHAPFVDGLDHGRPTTTSRAELYSGVPKPAKPAPAPAPLPPAHVVPASVLVCKRDVPLYQYAQLAQVDLARLRQRSSILKDAFAPAQREALPDNDALRSGDRRRIMAWILDAQLFLARAAGLDPSHQWSVTREFGAPADLLARDDGTSTSEPGGGGGGGIWDCSGPSDEFHNLVPYDMAWHKPWRPSSSASGGASSRGSSRASTRSAASSAVDPRGIKVAAPRELPAAPVGGEARYAWPWRSDSSSTQIDARPTTAAGAPSRRSWTLGESVAVDAMRPRSSATSLLSAEELPQHVDQDHDAEDQHQVLVVGESPTGFVVGLASSSTHELQ